VKDDLFYIDYILECISRIEPYTRAGRQSFFSESMIADAVVRSPVDGLWGHRRGFYDDAHKTP